MCVCICHNSVFSYAFLFDDEETISHMGVAVCVCDLMCHSPRLSGLICVLMFVSSHVSLLDHLHLCSMIKPLHIYLWQIVCPPPGLSDLVCALMPYVFSSGQMDGRQR